MCGKPLVVSDITFKHFTIKEIAFDIGEDRYFQAINLFTVKPSDFMVELYESGVDYRKVDPYDIFLSFFRETLVMEDGRVVLDDESLPVFNSGNKMSKLLELLTGIEDFMFFTDGKECFLYSRSSRKKIDGGVYNIVRQYYTKMHFFSQSERYNPGNDTTIKFLVKQEKRRRELEARKTKRSQLDKYISALVWSSGFTHDQILNMYVYQFYDGIERVGRIQEYNHLCSGYFCGNVAQKDFKSAVEKVFWAG